MLISFDPFQTNENFDFFPLVFSDFFFLLSESKDPQDNRIYNISVYRSPQKSHPYFLNNGHPSNSSPFPEYFTLNNIDMHPPTPPT